MTLAELIRLQRRCHGKERLLASAGDGYLYVHNPYFRRVRKAALRAGFRFSQRDPTSYFGFPLIHLDSILAEGEIPYRPSFSALLHLERSRPGHFELRDLFKNRPAPNYLLHESAHAVAFRELFGRPRDVGAAFEEPAALVRLMLGESYAMTAEYFAACAVEGSVHDWFFSISSYRHRTPKKKAIGELLDELGFPFVARAVLLAFLFNNFLVDRLERRRFEELLAHARDAKQPEPSARARSKLREALNGLMVMSPEFRYDTARLFLGMFGRSRNIRRELARDPLALLEAEAGLQSAPSRLTAILASG
jgi:hypothetical protein